MKRPRETVEIDFVPFVCRDCGQLQIAADLRRTNAPSNCDSCEGVNVFRAGPMQKNGSQCFPASARAVQKGRIVSDPAPRQVQILDQITEFFCIGCGCGDYSPCEGGCSWAAGRTAQPASVSARIAPISRWPSCSRIARRKQKGGNRGQGFDCGENRGNPSDLQRRRFDHLGSHRPHRRKAWSGRRYAIPGKKEV